MSLTRLASLVLCGALVSLGCSSGGDGDAKDKKEKSEKKKKSKKKKGKSKKKKSKAKAKESATPKPDDGSIPAPELGEVPKLKVGAWMTMKMKIGDITWGVLEKRETRFLIDAKVVGRINLDINAWVNVPEEGATRKTTLEELKYRMNGGAIRSAKGNALSSEQQVWAHFMNGYLPVKFEGLPQEDVTVAAGTFRGCYRWISESNFRGTKSKATIWSHPAVPAPSMVRMRSEDGSMSELIAYGQTGAKSSF